MINQSAVCSIVSRVLGLVGLSFGVPNRPTSFSGAFTTAGKFLVILTCYFGKTRGLPKARDQVIDFRFAKLKNTLHDLETEQRKQSFPVQQEPAVSY